MAESNLKEMMIDDINEDADEENQIIDNMPKLKWYLIDTERTFCKLWEFLVTWILIYSLFVTPFILVFDKLHSCYRAEYDINCVETSQNITIQNIELALDIIWLIEIIFNFLKKTRAHRDLKSIAQNYITGYFIFDVISLVPGIFQKTSRPIMKYYWLKMFRIVHVFRLTYPLELLLQFAL